MSVSETEWNSDCVCREVRGLWGWTTWSRRILSANKASSMYLTRTQRERERERSSCWRRRVRQRGSRGLSLLALQWEDCKWEEAEGEQEKGEDKKGKEQAGSRAVCFVFKETSIHLCECVWVLCRPSLLQPPLLSTPVLHNLRAEGPCSRGGLFPGLLLSFWGWWGCWHGAQSSSIIAMRTWCEPCLQCRVNAPTSLAFTASGAAWRDATSTWWSSVITQASMRHVSNTWFNVGQSSVDEHEALHQKYV